MLKGHLWTIFAVFYNSLTFIVRGYQLDHFNLSKCCDTNHNYWIDPICIPKGYDPSIAPNFGNRSVRTNIVLATRNSIYYNELKHIDVYKMSLTYSPKLVVSWVDQRLIFCHREPKRLKNSFLFSTNSTNLWRPKITIKNCVKSETFFNDPGKFSKFLLKRQF